MSKSTTEPDSSGFELLSNCTTAQMISFHPVYRVAQIYQFLVACFAFPPLFYFIFFKLIKSSFHGNLKCVLIGYFVTVLAFTINFQIVGFVQVLLPFISRTPCDLIINGRYLKYGHPTGSFIMTLSTLLPICITIERFFAMKNAETYEKTPVKLGPIITFLLIIIDLTTVSMIHRNSNFDAGSISFVIFPSLEVGLTMMKFFIIIVIFNVINFLFNIKLIRDNAKLKSINSTLSTKFQLEEVYFSTMFVITVVFYHVAFFCSYIILVLTFLVVGPLLFNPIDVWAGNGILMTIMATYNLVIGIVAVNLYNKIQTIKSEELNGKVQIQTTGNTGAQNYVNVTNRIWNSNSIAP
nr:RecName: Full=Serpentine receptor class beta-8/9; AltName: Full=Protein srb-8/Srb-9 [Caenorhabditis elegans]|eukprot:NP_498569.2 Serpentine receptor class beta-8/9 [Caenorhabditis elegans]